MGKKKAHLSRWAFSSVVLLFVFLLYFATPVTGFAFAIIPTTSAAFATPRGALSACIFPNFSLTFAVRAFNHFCYHVGMCVCELQIYNSFIYLKYFEC
jgi:hypothetical protein